MAWTIGYVAEDFPGKNGSGGHRVLARRRRARSMRQMAVNGTRSVAVYAMWQMDPVTCGMHRPSGCSW